MQYQTGFGNHFATEAISGALPIGRNSPQQPPFGLYAEQFSGSAFAAPRSENRHSWLYRMRPSAAHPQYLPYSGRTTLCAAPFVEVPPSPNRLRWDPLPLPGTSALDFIDGLITYCGNGETAASGVAIHLYIANQSMQRRCFQCSDGELLIVPQQGRLAIDTELGRLAVGPGHIALIPRGVRFRVSLTDGAARGYVCENYAAPFRLPDLGLIGSNGLANARDFEAPVAWFEDADEDFEVVQKFQGGLWSMVIDHSPFDVVAWHGNLTPLRYDLARFNTLGTVSFDHPDPSILTVLTSPSETPGTANCDFVIFPPRWAVAEDTFRPPWFHRNVMSEFMGLICGEYDAKQGGGFMPGGASLHNQMNGHGPDTATAAKAVQTDLKPQKIDNSLAFMFESRWVLRPTAFAMSCPQLQNDYDACWSGFPKARLPT